MSHDMGSLYEDLQHECIELRADLARVTEEVERRGGIIDRLTTQHEAVVKKAGVQAERLARAEGLLRETRADVVHEASQREDYQEFGPVIDRIDAYFGESRT